MPGVSVNAIGRLGERPAPWFGIARRGSAPPPSGAGSGGEGYVLVFGEEDGSLRLAASGAAGDSPRGVLLALIAFFEGEARDPPPELEMTHWEAAEAVRWLAAKPSSGARRDPWQADSLREALDAIDDGLPADVITGHLYRALEAGSPGRGAHVSPVAELRRIYETARAGAEAPDPSRLEF